MKLSAFFSGIDAVWSSYSFPWLGMVSVVYIGIAYAMNRFASTRSNSALLYGVYAFALFLVLALLSAKSFDALLREPLLLAMIAALAGAGIDVYRRLKTA
jgi:hypothetical protein